MQKKRQLLLFLLMDVLMLFGFGCEKWITGYGPQPIYLDKSVNQPMLNVLGILRPGMEQAFPLSFVHVEAAFPVTDDMPDSLKVADVTVQVTQIPEGSSTVYSFIYQNPDHIFQQQDYRHAEFIPQTGETYFLLCRKEGYPDLTGQTTVPDVPEILDIQMDQNQTLLTITVARDALAGLIEAILLVGDNQFSTRVLRPESGPVEIVLHFNAGNSESGQLMIVAYDLNLSEYMTYNISVKPNTYLDMYSTVENGYGCFGSLNVVEKTVLFRSTETE